MTAVLEAIDGMTTAEKVRGGHGEFRVEVAALAQFGEEVLTWTGCENLGRANCGQSGGGQTVSCRSF